MMFAVDGGALARGDSCESHEMQVHQETDHGV